MLLYIPNPSLQKPSPLRLRGGSDSSSLLLPSLPPTVTERELKRNTFYVFNKPHTSLVLSSRSMDTPLKSKVMSSTYTRPYNLRKAQIHGSTAKQQRAAPAARLSVIRDQRHRSFTKLTDLQVHGFHTKERLPTCTLRADNKLRASVPRLIGPVLPLQDDATSLRGGA